MNAPPLACNRPTHQSMVEITNTAKVVNYFNFGDAGFHVLNCLSAVASWTDQLSLPRQLSLWAGEMTLI